MRRKAATIVCILLLLPSLATAEELLAAYSRALRDGRSGDSQKVQSAFETLRNLAEENPDDKLADDALFQAGEIAERYLNQYDKAEAIYNQVIERYPNSRSALRAKGALRRLERGRATGDRPYRIYTNILANYSKLGSEKAMQQMILLSQQYPDFQHVDRVLFWIADEYSRRNENLASIPYYQKVIERFPDRRYALLAQIGLGDTFIEMRDFHRAIDEYKKVASMTSFKDVQKISDYYIGVTHEFIVLWGIFWLCLIIVAIWLIRVAFFTIWREFRPAILYRLWPELAFVCIPLIGGLIYVWNRSLYMKQSIGFLLIFAPVMIVLNSLHITLSRKKITTLLYAVFAGMAMFCLTYVIFYLTDLINVLRDSLKMTFNL